MDVSTLGLSAPYASLVTATLVLLPLAWVVARSRSLFMVRQRLWRLLHRRPAGEEPWLDEAVRERFELMRFRALVMWADSLAEARRINDWAKGQGIDVGLLGDCGKYFHRHRLAVREKLPALLGAKAWTTMVKLVLFGGIAMMAALGTEDGAYLRLRHDHTWIVATAGHARPALGGTGREMTLDDCKARQDTAGFGEENRAIVCRTLGAEGLDKLLREGLLAQRALLAFAGLWCLGGVWAVQHNLAALRAAHATRAWLGLRAAGTGDGRDGNVLNADASSNEQAPVR